MSIHTSTLRAIAMQGWPVCDEVADEVEYLEKECARLQLEKLELQRQLLGDGCAVCNPELAAEMAQSVSGAVDELPPLPESLEIEWPQLNSQALGCGVEDRSLHDRYECAEYGWQDGVDRAIECVPEDIYNSDQMHEYARAALSRAQQAPAVGDDRFIPVLRSAVDWLKIHYPALCVKAGLCESVAGRLYTVTTLKPTAAPVSEQTKEQSK